MWGGGAERRRMSSVPPSLRPSVSLFGGDEREVGVVAGGGHGQEDAFDQAVGTSEHHVAVGGGLVVAEGAGQTAVGAGDGDEREGADRGVGGVERRAMAVEIVAKTLGVEDAAPQPLDQ